MVRAGDNHVLLLFLIFLTLLLYWLGYKPSTSFQDHPSLSGHGHPAPTAPAVAPATAAPTVAAPPSNAGNAGNARYRNWAAVMRTGSTSLGFSKNLVQMIFFGMGWNYQRKSFFLFYAEMMQSSRCQGRARSSFASVTSLTVTDEPNSARQDPEA